MGNYTGRVFRLILKKETPQEILDVLQTIVDDGSITTKVAGNEDLQSMWEHISYLMSVSSAYFESWCTRKLEQNDAGQWELLTYASTKDVNHDLVRLFLLGMQPYLVLTDDQIVYREIYEEAVQEKIIFYRYGEFEAGLGWRYDGEIGSYDDNHPRNCDEVGSHEDPPWNRHEVLAKLKELKANKPADPYDGCFPSSLYQ